MAKKKTKVEPQDEDGETADVVAVNDAWTGMLVISFLALSIGTGFVLYEFFVRYGGFDAEPPRAIKFGAPPPAVQPPPQPKPAEPPKVDDKKVELRLLPGPANPTVVAGVSSRDDIAVRLTHSYL